MQGRKKQKKARFIYPIKPSEQNLKSLPSKPQQNTQEK
jgi:hypothetical protein